MNTQPTSPYRAVSALHEQVLTDLFAQHPGDASFENILANMDALRAAGSLVPCPHFAGLSSLELTHVVRNALFARLAEQLPALVRLAQSHVDDIESGLQEGIYSADDNADLPFKKQVVDVFSACLEPMPMPPSSPSLVLVVLSRGGIVETHSQVGVLPGVLVEVIDCMNGEAGDQFLLDECWSDLVNQAFCNDVPDFVTVKRKP